MERIQRALDLAKTQRTQPSNLEDARLERTQPSNLEDARLERAQPSNREDARLERAVLNREFAAVPVEYASRVALDWAALRERRIVSFEENHPANQAYRMLRTQVLQRARTHGLHTLGIVSAVNGEGKTVTAINLALSLAAEPNQSVLLVDLDLRRPAVAQTLGLSVDCGLETWFGTGDPTKNVCYAIEKVERLFVLPTLAPVTGSSEALAGLGTRRLLNELKERDGGGGRLLIIDLPPVLLSDDALTIAPLLDGVVLVVNERRTRREDVARVIELLGNTRVVGTVLNRSSQSEQRAY